MLERYVVLRNTSAKPKEIKDPVLPNSRVTVQPGKTVTVQVEIYRRQVRRIQGWAKVVRSADEVSVNAPFGLCPECKTPLVGIGPGNEVMGCPALECEYFYLPEKPPEAPPVVETEEVTGTVSTEVVDQTGTADGTTEPTVEPLP